MSVDERNQLWAIHLRKDFCSTSQEAVGIDKMLYGWLIKIQNKDPMVVMLTHDDYVGSEIDEKTEIDPPELTYHCIKTPSLWKTVSRITKLDLNRVEWIVNTYRDQTTTRPRMYLTEKTKDPSHYDRVWEIIEPVVTVESIKLLEKVELD